MGHTPGDLGLPGVATIAEQNIKVVAFEVVSMDLVVPPTADDDSTVKHEYKSW